MATYKQVTNFIKTLAALAQAEAKKRNKWVLPSVCIAQAALETGWGTSSLMVKANAYFGIKANASWTGKVYNSKTKECYDGVTFTDITACFRAYDSLAESVADYYDLICGASRYKAAVNNADAKSTITAIWEGGYATDPDYVSKVMSVIDGYNLTQYDNFATVTTTKKKVNAAVKAWQQAAIKDGYTFPKSGADGIWGTECVSVATKAIVKQRTNYTNKNLTKIVQSAVGVTADGLCGAKTTAAIKKYQAKKGLTADGAVGLNTWKKILGV